MSYSSFFTEKAVFTGKPPPHIPMSHLLDLNVAECMLRCCEKEHDTRFSIADEICVIEEEIQWYCTCQNVLN